MLTSELKAAIEAMPRYYTLSTLRIPPGVEADWIIMNASEFLFGHRIWFGPAGKAGTFFAAIDPEAQDAPDTIRRNRKADPSIVIILTHKEADQMFAKYRKEKEAKHPMAASMPDEAMRQLFMSEMSFAEFPKTAR